MSARVPRLAAGACAALLVTAAPGAARAQSAAPATTAPATTALPAVLHGCWVPVSGTIYRIDPSGATAGLPRACLSAAHRAFEWNQQGPAGPPGERGPQGEPGPPGASGAVPVFNTDFYDLSGPNPLRSGFVARGALNEGSQGVPNGFGTRLVWYPRKQAFRAGGVSGNQWDEAKLAQSSFAGGGDTEASGFASTAFGAGSIASGEAATALGWGSTASGRAAFAAGEGARASGSWATALGFSATASGSNALASGFNAFATGSGSIALGTSILADGTRSVVLGTSATANGRTGAMLLADSRALNAPLSASADDQFSARFRNGYRFGVNEDASQGCTINAQGDLACTGTITGTNSAIGPDLTLPGALSMGRTGTFGGGLLASDAAPLTVPSGGGTRFMWVPQLAAVRGGAIAGAQWDPNRIGVYSTAFGVNVSAAGRSAIAMGETVVADQPNSVALGRDVTAGTAGSFVYGDAVGGTAQVATAANQFAVRASGGVRLRTSSDLAKGCDVDGQGNLTCSGTVTGAGLAVPSFVRLRSQTYVVNSPGSRKEYQSCPAGTFVIAGGVETPQSSIGTDMKVRASYPDFVNNRWYAEVRNDAFDDSWMIISVVCVRQ